MSIISVLLITFGVFVASGFAFWYFKVISVPLWKVDQEMFKWQMDKHLEQMIANNGLTQYQFRKIERQRTEIIRSAGTV